MFVAGREVKRGYVWPELRTSLVFLDDVMTSWLARIGYVKVA